MKAQLGSFGVMRLLFLLGLLNFAWAAWEHHGFIDFKLPEHVEHTWQETAGMTHLFLSSVKELLLCTCR